MLICVHQEELETREDSKKMKKPIKKAATKKISEYGGMEKYTSKKAEMKHEKKEGKTVEAKEKMMFSNLKKKKK